jgi:uncharacterized delta-60 repeat protein
MKTLNFSILVLTTIFVFFITNTYAQQVTEQWARVFDFNGQNNESEGANGVVADESGNVYVTGFTYGSANPNGTIITLKYNSGGTLVWSRAYTDTNLYASSANAIALDNSGSIYVAGWRSLQNQYQDMVLLKYNSAGTLLWRQSYNGIGNVADEALVMKVDNNYVYIAGYIYNQYGTQDFATLKYSLGGSLLWVKTYGSLFNPDIVRGIDTDPFGNVYVTGEFYGETTQYDYATIKYLPDGTQAWVVTYDFNDSYDKAAAIDVDDQGNVYVTGGSYNQSSMDYATIKYNTSGQLIWAKRYDGPDGGNDEASSIAVDDNGNVFVTGYSNSNAGGPDYLTIKYNGQGNTVWTKRYNGNSSSYGDYAVKVKLDTTGDIYVTGYAYYGTGRYHDFTTIKYDNASGNQDWLMSYGYNGLYDYTNALYVDMSGSVYAAGSVMFAANNTNMGVVKYSQPVILGVNNQNIQIANDFRLEQNFPNPFNPSTSISYSVPNPGNVKISVYDITGRLVSTIVNEYKNAGSYELKFDGSKLASGTYFYRMDAVGYSDVKKMMLVK